jgi:hypothetical protein
VQQGDGAEFGRGVLEAVTQSNVLLSKMWADAVRVVQYAESGAVVASGEMRRNLGRYRDALRAAFDSSGPLIGSCRTAITGEYVEPRRRPAPPPPPAQDDDDLEDDEEDDFEDDDDVPDGAIDPDRFRS